MPAAAHPRDEQRRLAALLSCGVLDTAAEPAFDDLTRLASRLCAAPVALISLVDASRQWFKSSVGLDARETPREHAFCAWAILGQGPLVITDASTDPRTADNPLVTGEPGIRFYAGAPLVLRDGAAVGTLCVIDFEPRDPTHALLADLNALARQAASQLELRRAVRQFEAARDAADEASRAKSAFLANMSHELRTPMTAILGYLDLLTDPAATPEDREDHARTVRRNGEHLLGLINDILDLSKIEAGGLTLDPTECRPARKLADVVGLLGPVARQRGVTLDASFEGPVPEAVLADRLRVRQILVNLVGNALKFTPEGGRVALRASFDPAASVLRFEVEDTGIGMTPDEIARLFRPFAQADASTTRRFGGTGLGLSISKGLAELMGGRIDVRSTPGRGSVFTLTMPATPLGAATITDWRDAPKAPAAPVAPATGALRGVRVLLAEDGPDNQRLIATILRRQGADVDVVPDGAEALRRLTAPGAGARYDVALMDMQMPELDGYEAARRARAAGAPVPIIALTASAMAEDRARCLAAGCSDYATKPIDRHALVELCVRWAARRAAA